MFRLLWIGLACIPRIAHAEPPTFDGHISLGVRETSMSDPHYDFVANDTGSVRAAAEGLVGMRFGRTVVGVHAGIATPYKFYTSPLYDSGEVVAGASSTIYPVDFGLGVQIDAWPRVWVSAWVGATISFEHATSPAQRIDAIGFSGDIPAATWTDHTSSLGYGAAVAYDVIVNDHGAGKLAAFVAVDSQGLFAIPERANSGGTGSLDEDFTCRSVTLGLAYRY